jgi:hypothetical protein
MRTPVRILVVTAATLGAVGLMALSHWWFPSYALSMTISNRTTAPVRFHYRGTFLERGTVVLPPGESRRVVVYRGESRPDGQMPVACEASWNNNRYARTFNLDDAALRAPDGGRPQVVVRESGIAVEVATSLPGGEN